MSVCELFSVSFPLRLLDKVRRGRTCGSSHLTSSRTQLLTRYLTECVASTPIGVSLDWVRRVNSCSRVSRRSGSRYFLCVSVATCGMSHDGRFHDVEFELKNLRSNREILIQRFGFEDRNFEFEVTDSTCQVLHWGFWILTGWWPLHSPKRWNLTDFTSSSAEVQLSHLGDRPIENMELKFDHQNLRFGFKYRDVNSKFANSGIRI